MGKDFQIGPRLESLVQRVVESYYADERTRHIDRLLVPSRDEIIRLVQTLLELLFPGFFGRQNLTRYNVAFHVGELLPRIGDMLYRQIYRCLCYAQEARQDNGQPVHDCDEIARDVTMAFIEDIPAIRQLLGGDVQAAFDGDPAAGSVDEIILSYPGVLGVAVYRVAHALYLLKVPLLPRIISEWAHMTTGIDIHPGADIGRHFFIDHGTGVVIGETTDIGDHVKIYQGVTLGALSFPRDDHGCIIRGAKRHPTIRDHVTIYANAIILGGETVIGEHAVIGGSVFVTSSVPPNSVVTFTPPELRLRPRGPARPGPVEAPRDAAFMPDYMI